MYIKLISSNKFMKYVKKVSHPVYYIHTVRSFFSLKKIPLKNYLVNDILSKVCAIL